MRTVGILGGGQLGAMLAHSLQDLGADVLVHDPDPSAPALRCAAGRSSSPWGDVATLQRLFDRCDAVTYEFENVETDGLRRVEGLERLHPSLDVLETAQDRIREKEFFRAQGIPHAAFAAGRDPDALPEMARAFGLPAILKTARGGYDGKGQWRIETPGDLAPLLEGAARGALSRGWVLEEPIEIEREVSAIVAREPDGSEHLFPLFENAHRDHVLDLTLVPARLSALEALAAEEAALTASRALGVVGLLTVELFIGRSRREGGEPRVLANELAPRPHNSGHVTRKACTFSQFDALARVLLGFPLVPPALRSGGDVAGFGAYAMANLLGDVWLAQGRAELDLGAWNGHPEVLEVVLYGKEEAREKRKMGHVITGAVTAGEALAAAAAFRAALARRAASL